MAEAGHGESIHLQPWPAYDEALVTEESIRVAITINGKPRDEIEIPVAVVNNHSEVVALALERPKVRAYLDGRAPSRRVYVPGWSTW